MKLRFLILIMFLAVIAQPAGPQQVTEPLGKDQVMDLVKAGMETPELVNLIHEHGIDFDLSDDYLQALRQAGAQDAVIQALRAARPKPLTKEQVLQLVAGGVPSERAATLVKQHGIDFLADERYLATLRLAGADDTLIAAVREASAAATGQLVVVTSPNAEVFLDGELQGRANAQGELAMKAKLGTHALKVTLAGKKDFEQSIMLAGRQATQIEARLEDLPGKIVIQTSPGADVFIDGAHRGAADGAGQLVIPEAAPGSHELRISASGRQEYRRSISVVPGQESRVEALLADLGSPRPQSRPVEVGHRVEASPESPTGLRFPVLIEQGWMDEKRRAGYLLIANGRIKYQNEKDRAHEFDAPLSEATGLKVGKVMGMPLLYLWVSGKQYKFYVGNQPENVRDAIERAKGEP
jgi:hypothetical protein